MYFPAAFILALLPFLVEAVPAQNSPRSVLSIPLSKRSTHYNADGFVDIQNLQASVYHAIAKFEEGSKAFKRNTGKPHPLVSREVLQNTTSNSNSSTISLTDDVHSDDQIPGLWYGDISVGSPAGTYTVAFDTGSGNFVLPSSFCFNCYGSHNRYNSRQSSTAKNLGESAIFYFSNGLVSGDVFTEYVVVGGFEAANLTMLVASEYSNFYGSKSFGADGVMGLGFKEIAAFNAPPLIETLVDQGQLEEPIFGFYLAGSDSELIIGGRDSSRYSGDLTYVDVEKGYWQTTFDAISVNGKNITVGTQEAIIDTGTALILGDQESISNIYAEIPGSLQVTNSTLWTIPCKTNVTVSIKFNGTTFNISPKTYNVGTLSVALGNCMGGFSTATLAGSGPMGNPTKSNPTPLILGDVFLRNVYSEFDYGNLRVGFAQLANEK